MTYVSVEQTEETSINEHQYLPGDLPRFRSKNNPISKLAGDCVFQQDEKFQIEKPGFLEQPAAQVLCGEVELCRQSHAGHVLRQQIKVEQCSVVEYRYRFKKKEYSIFLNPAHNLVEDLSGPIQTAIEDTDKLAQKAFDENRYEDAYRLNLKSLCMVEATEAEKRLRVRIFKRLNATYLSSALLAWLIPALSWSFLHPARPGHYGNLGPLLGLIPLLIGARLFTRDTALRLQHPSSRFFCGVLIGLAAFLCAAPVNISLVDWQMEQPLGNWTPIVTVISLLMILATIRAKERNRRAMIEEYVAGFPSQEGLEGYVRGLDPKNGSEAQAIIGLCGAVTMLCLALVWLWVAQDHLTIKAATTLIREGRFDDATRRLDEEATFLVGGPEKRSLEQEALLGKALAEARALCQGSTVPISPGSLSNERWVHAVEGLNAAANKASDPEQRKKVEAAHQALIQTGFLSTDRLSKSGRIDEAASLLKTLTVLYPQNTNVAHALKSAYESRISTAEGLASRWDPVSGSVQDWDYILRLYREAKAFAEKPEVLEEPIRKAQQRRRVDEEFQGAIAAANSAVEVKNWADAKTAVEAALKLKPGNLGASALQKQIAKLSAEDFRTTMATVQQLVNERNYPGALTNLIAALKIEPGDTKALQQHEEVRYLVAMEDAETKLKADLLEDADKQVGAALRMRPGDIAAMHLGDHIARKRTLEQTPKLTLKQLLADCFEKHINESTLITINGKPLSTERVVFKPGVFDSNYKGRTVRYECPDGCGVSEIKKDGTATVKTGDPFLPELIVAPRATAQNNFRSLRRGEKIRIVAIIQALHQSKEFIVRLTAPKLFLKEAEIIE